MTSEIQAAESIAAGICMAPWPDLTSNMVWELASDNTLPGRLRRS
jgi:hypothetical protein